MNGVLCVCIDTMIMTLVSLLYSRTSIDNSKRWGTLPLVNQLFKIYFKVSTCV